MSVDMWAKPKDCDEVVPSEVRPVGQVTLPYRIFCTMCGQNASPARGWRLTADQLELVKVKWRRSCARCGASYTMFATERENSGFLHFMDNNCPVQPR